MRIGAIGILLCLTASSCGGTPGAPVSLTPVQQLTAEAEVRSSLRDPASAQFMSIAAVRYPNGDLWACGVVNARNGFGGFAGPTPYLGRFIGEHFNVGMIGGTRSESIAVLSACHSYGIMI